MVLEICALIWIKLKQQQKKTEKKEILNKIFFSQTELKKIQIEMQKLRYFPPSFHSVHKKQLKEE